MEAPRGGGRITPLPPSESEGWDHEPTVPRPRLPAAFALAGLVAFALWLSGAAQPAGPPDAGSAGPSITGANLSSPEPESVEPPPITQPPVLDERLPWLDGRDLLLFSSTRTTDELIVWDGSVAEPQRFPLSGANIVDFEPEPRTTNFIAYETAGNAFALYVGGWQRQEPIFVGTHGFDWDPAGTGTLMWIGTDQVTGATSLYRRELNDTIELVAPMPEGTRLVGWNETGLVIRVQSGGPVNFVDADSGAFEVRQAAVTSLYDTSGTLLASALADPLAVTPAGPIVARGTGTVFAEGSIDVPDDVGLTPPDTFVLLDPPQGASDQFTYRPIPKREALADTEIMFSSQRPWSALGGCGMGRARRHARRCVHPGRPRSDHPGGPSHPSGERPCPIHCRILAGDGQCVLLCGRHNPMSSSSWIRTPGLSSSCRSRATFGYVGAFLRDR